MSHSINSVVSTQTLPKKVDVVIIGAGIVGASAAWFLSQYGLSVAVCEKGQVGGEQSSRNLGFCRKQGRDLKELPLAIESLRVWRDLEKETQGRTGFKVKGVLYIASSEATMERFENWLKRVEHYQLDTQILGSKEVTRIFPNLQTNYMGGLWTPSDGGAEPSKASSAIVQIAQRSGAQVFTRCAVRGLETANGRISAVVTEIGTILCDAVLLAGGVWSSLFLKRYGISFPQLRVSASVQRTTKGPEVTSAGLFCPGLGMRRRRDGKYILTHGTNGTVNMTPDIFRWMNKFWNAFLQEHNKLKFSIGSDFLRELTQTSRWTLDSETPFEQTRILNPSPDNRSLDNALIALKNNFPLLRNLEIEERWAGMIDVTPDAVPCIAQLIKLPGLYLASGFSGHGFGIGPGAGKLAAQLIAGASTCVDIEPFRYERFFDGTQLEPESL